MDKVDIVADFFLSLKLLLRSLAFIESKTQGVRSPTFPQTFHNDGS